MQDRWFLLVLEWAGTNALTVLSASHIVVKTQNNYQLRMLLDNHTLLEGLVCPDLTIIPVNAVMQFWGDENNTCVSRVAIHSIDINIVIFACHIRGGNASLAAESLIALMILENLIFTIQKTSCLK